MPTQQQQLLRIGELKTASQVSIKTIRYYEELGLIQATQRTEGGFRLFSLHVLPRLAFIKRSQSLGFSLQEIGQILEIHDQGELPCEQVRRKLRVKISEIEQRIQQLQTLQGELRSLISDRQPLPERKAGIICPILQSSSAR